MDDIASPPQIKEALEEIERLKEFKTKSVPCSWLYKV